MTEKGFEFSRRGALAGATALGFVIAISAKTANALQATIDAESMRDPISYRTLVVF